jgi:hypothetical protein
MATSANAVAAPSIEQLPGFNSKADAVSYLAGFAKRGDRVVVKLPRKMEPFAVVSGDVAERRGWAIVGQPVEAHGVKGMKSTAWRKTFRSPAALNAWLEKTGAQMLGMREVA